MPKNKIRIGIIWYLAITQPVLFVCLWRTMRHYTLGRSAYDQPETFRLKEDF